MLNALVYIPKENAIETHNIGDVKTSKGNQLEQKRTNSYQRIAQR